VAVLRRTGISGSSCNTHPHAEIKTLGAASSSIDAAEKKNSVKLPQVNYSQQYRVESITRGHFEKAGLKQKAIHEFTRFISIFLYLAFFFCAVTTYRMLLLSDFRDSYINYTFAVINALVIAKVILIGEYTHLGKRLEDQPLLVSSIYKAFLFGLLTFAFHIVEEAIKGVLHGKGAASAVLDIHLKDLLARTIVIFCTFIPLFGFREVWRVLGERKFNELFFHRQRNGRADPIK
jgi:hypothetical protein